MGRNPLQTAHRQIPTEGPSESEASNRSSSAGARIFLFPGTNRLFSSVFLEIWGQRTPLRAEISKMSPESVCYPRILL